MQRLVGPASAVGGPLLILLGVALVLYAPDRPLWGWAVVVAGAALSGWVVARRREYLRALLTPRALREGANAAVLAAAVIGIAVLVNVIAARHPLRWDLTRTRLHSLSPQTLEVLRGLKEKVRAIAFVREGNLEEQQIADLLKEYGYRSRNVEVQLVDPDKNPGLAKKYGVEAYGTVVIETEKRRRVIEPFDLYGFSGGLDGGTEFRGEQAFTRAILEVTVGQTGRVYFLTGHGELTLERDLSRAARFLEGDGYTVQAINLAQAGQVPQDASVVVLAGPQRDLDPREIRALDAYLNRGGAALVLVRPPIQRAGELPALRGWLARWGVVLDDVLVVDPARHYFLDSLSPIPEYEEHPVTEKLLRDRLAVVLPQSRSVRPASVPPEKVRVTPILRTSPEAWGEVDFNAQTLRRDARDLKGPLTLGVAVTKELGPAAGGSQSGEKGSGGQPPAGDGSSGGSQGGEPRTARLTVIGSASFVTNDVLTFQGNVDFLANAVNWLAGKQELITIRPKTQEFARVQMTAAETSFVFYTAVLLMPALLLLAGGATWWRRRAL